MKLALEQNKSPRRGFSTSALARELRLPTGELFTLLRDLGWIKRGQEVWLLTAKGEFEGGRYVDSERYGRYILWPASALNNRALHEARAQWVVSASRVARGFRVSGRYLNHVLHELGWIVPGIKGWRITPAGAALGGVEIEDEETCVPFVKWPPEIVRHQRLRDALIFSYGDWVAGERESTADLFASGACFRGIDGHVLNSLAEAAICNWLYFAGLTHACGRLLSGSEEHRIDFYLPASNVSIEYWGERLQGEGLSCKLATKVWMEDNRLSLIELKPDDIGLLDDVLARELLRAGVPVY